jgi:acyl-coenzyme A synthetase/AMP-(fatty) acid ligase
LLTPYEIPARVFVVDRLPRGAALKVDRRELVAMLTKLRDQQADTDVVGSTAIDSRENVHG